MNHLQAIKTEQRRLAKARLSALSKEERAKKSAEICRRLSEDPGVWAAQSILSYRAGENEVDLAALHRILSAQGKTLAFPRVISDGVMDAFIPNNGEAFVIGAFGISEPDPASSVLLPPSRIGLVLVPCLAFDRKGHRLGHGKGFYDRFLPRCAKDVKTILIAFAEQELETVETEENDVTIPQIVSF